MTKRDPWKGRAGFDLDVRNTDGKMLCFFHAAPADAKQTMLDDFDRTTRKAREFLARYQTKDETPSRQ